MRPPRVLILIFFFSVALFLFCRSITSFAYRNRHREPKSASLGLAESPAKSNLRSFFSFSTPFTLFPPNAVISLTDDNSTSFQARPAAFGPPLPAKGLSGQLWIGSGFADDNLPEGEGEGELGCSDVPGWEDGTSGLAALAGLKPARKVSFSKASKFAAENSKSTENPKSQSGRAHSPLVDREAQPDSRDDLAKAARPFDDDGTDDYLHQGFQRSSPSAADKIKSHADIQSMQETAEITGKVVLLSRGGCGFLEKVKWAQRRGAVGVIVGDNTKGGPLIQMFARGDTSNVTIPAIFTSRTTAHILSSLMQPGSFIEDIIDEDGKAIVKVQQTDKGRRSKRTRHQANKVDIAKKDISKKEAPKKDAPNKDAPKKDAAATPPPQPKSRGWFGSFFRWSASVETVQSSSTSREWVLVDDWSDEKDSQIRTSMEKAVKKGLGESGDGPQKGAADLRAHESADAAAAQRSTKGKAASASGNKSGGKSTGVTPSSGQYAPDTRPGEDKGSAIGKTDATKPAVRGPSLTDKLFGGQDKSESAQAKWASISVNSDEADLPNPRQGLWVTITPTSSGSPFFDTLLVLVVSPLITLSVVYALLILRAKLRRRRWRAPKSIVEQLPVRTYHTVATSSNNSRLPSPTSSSPTTPLLQQQQLAPTPQLPPAATSSRPRPRSRTTNDVPDSSDAILRVDPDLQSSPSRTGRRGRRSPPQLSSEWKKYMGRQFECVVCLEEYVDGVSRVMSLPCGHEFHVECITPWLTTRRRTCPICKGDVVRSLARANSQYDAYEDDSDYNGESSSSRRPISPPSSDPEHGILSPPNRSPNRRPGGTGSAFLDMVTTGWISRAFVQRPPGDLDDHDDRRMR